MSSPENAPSKPDLDDRPLPQVEPPSAGFLLQLFVIPMLIVAIIVVVYMMFSWLANMGTNPQELVRSLRKSNEVRWQRASTLANLLSNPKHEDLKHDVGMATELAAVLDDQIETADVDENSLRLRMFLCRALGEFRVPEALPPIVRAATAERELAEIDVRRSALEAIAVYANNNRDTELSENEACMDALIAASRERADAAEKAERTARNDLRSTAAYVLGVVGGAPALDRLEILLDDSYTNARYNAATGLCRHGDARGIDVLLEMLDPENQESISEEDKGDEYGEEWKRVQVINAGIQSASQLLTENKDSDMESVRVALQSIVDSELSAFTSRNRNHIRLEAKEALLLSSTPSEPTAAN